MEIRKIRTRISKQEQTLAYKRAFNKATALTEKEIYLTQFKLFSYKRHNKILDAVYRLKPELKEKIWGETRAWGDFVTTIYNILKQPTTSRQLHSGNLSKIAKRSNVIKRFKENGVYRYYLSY